MKAIELIAAGQPNLPSFRPAAAPDDAPPISAVAEVLHEDLLGSRGNLPTIGNCHVTHPEIRYASDLGRCHAADQCSCWGTRSVPTP